MSNLRTALQSNNVDATIIDTVIAECEAHAINVDAFEIKLNKPLLLRIGAIDGSNAQTLFLTTGLYGETRRLISTNAQTGAFIKELHMWHLKNGLWVQS